MAWPIATQTYRTGMFDFSRGMVASLATFKSRPRHARRVNNVLFRPARAFTVRGGSRNITSASFATGPNEVPHSLGRFYHASGPRLFAGTDDGTTRRIREVTASAITTQTLPFTPSAEIWTFDMVGAALVGAQSGGTEKPIFFDNSNPANTWHSIVLPKPGNTLTLTGAIGGNLTLDAVYGYRLRWRFKNGESEYSTPQSIDLSAVQNQVNLTTIPTSGRSDYLGWTLERTLALASGATLSGREEYFVIKSDGTATTYNDTTADADLFEKSDNGIHGEPQHMNGVIHHLGRLMGWAESTLYVSQQVADEQRTGPFNFHPLAAYVFATDDGDYVRTVIHQGDRLLVCKFGSLHGFEGESPLSFRVVPVYDGVGAVGPRAAASFGRVAFVFSDRGLHRVNGNEVKPFGWDEAGQYFDGLALSTISEVVLQNYKDQLLLIWFKNNSGTYEMVIYDLRTDTWSHHTGWRARAALVLRDGGFSNASLLFADPVDRKIWAGFEGNTDSRGSDGSGGVAIPWMAELPTIDDGRPNDWKDFEDLMVRIEGGSGNLRATIDLGPDRPPQSVNLAYQLSGGRVQPATQFPLRTGPGSNPAYVYKISGGRPAQLVTDLPAETIGKTHALTLSGDSTDGPTIFGYEMGAILLPQREG